ncbi:MAG: hypothetical protein V4510_00810 [bacterium]
MKRRTVRWGMKIGFLANVLFFVAVVLDYTRNESRWMVPLLFLYAAFVLTLILLYFARPRPAATSIPDILAAGDDTARITIAQRP